MTPLIAVAEKGTVVYTNDDGTVVDDSDINDDIDYASWWCISTDPFPCPNPACSFVAMHATAMHRILVWAEKDDDRLLDLCIHLVRAERNPKVVEYEVSMGPCLAYDQWEALRHPVHGIKAH